MAKKKDNKDNKSSEEKPTEKGKNIKDLKIDVDEFGAITTNLNLDDINQFLDENLEDKKLKDRKD